MGLGIRELRLLQDVITGITVSNGIPPDQATSRFFEDIEKNYENNLNFESKLNNLQAKVHKLNQRESGLRSQIMTLQLVDTSLAELLEKGVTKQDIVDFAELLDSDSYAGSFGSDTHNRDVTLKGIRSLIIELRKDGSIKNTLGKLSEDIDNLNNQVASLAAEKKDLEADNKRLLLYLSNLRNAASYISGYSVSLKDEFTWLASLTAYMICMLNRGAEQQKNCKTVTLANLNRYFNAPKVKT